MTHTAVYQSCCPTAAEFVIGFNKGNLRPTFQRPAHNLRLLASLQWLPQRHHSCLRLLTLYAIGAVLCRSAEFIIGFNKGIDAGANLLEACLASGVVQGKVRQKPSKHVVVWFGCHSKFDATVLLHRGITSLLQRPSAARKPVRQVNLLCYLTQPAQGHVKLCTPLPKNTCM